MITYKNYRFLDIERYGTVLVQRDGQEVARWPKAVFRGKTALEIVTLIERVHAAQAQLFPLAEALKQELPGVSFGYLGNHEMWGDDTSWMIFLPHPGRIGTYADRVGSYRSWELDRMLADWPRLAGAARAAMAKRT